MGSILTLWSLLTRPRSDSVEVVDLLLAMRGDFAPAGQLAMDMLKVITRRVLPALLICTVCLITPSLLLQRLGHYDERIVDIMLSKGQVWADNFVFPALHALCHALHRSLLGQIMTCLGP